jgi:N-acetyl-gamma-glutamyl-phosphate reductase
MIKAGIIGAAGFTGGELIRLLVNHPEVELAFAHSNSQQGKAVTQVHKDLKGDIDLDFKKSDPPDSLDVIFLCMGHGRSKQFLQDHGMAKKTKIIDLSHDYRLSKPGNDFVYGLPELNRHLIKQADKVANPGCFATAIQLALLPLATHNLLVQEVHVHALTGATGAGAGLLPTTHFSWRQNNLSVYKAFDHQHLDEIRQSLSAAGSSQLPFINFIPVRGDFTKGIFCTAYTEVDLNLKEIEDLYHQYYMDHPFTHVSRDTISLKQVINTNKCFLHLQYYQGKILITSIIDNLIKGASGQAIQNMNLMNGLSEALGLRLKAVAF